MQADSLVEIISAIYEAATDKTQWPAVLENVAAIMGATVALVPFLESPTSSRYGLIAAYNLDPNHPKEYPKYAHLDPYRTHSPEPVVSEFSQDSPRIFVRGSCALWAHVHVGETFMPERDFLKTEYYNEFWRRYEMCYHCGGSLFVEKSLVALVAVNRPRRAGPFGQREVKVLSALVPHLRRAIVLQRRLAAAEAKGRGVLNGLDSLPTGFILADGEGRVLAMNAAAERMLAQNDGLVARGQVLRAARLSESEKLREVLSSAIAPEAGNGVEAEGAVAISRPSLRRPYMVVVCPLRVDAIPSPGARPPAAAIFISDPDARPEANQRILRRLFGFTVAECRLVEQLLQGSALRRSAELLGISRNTAHSQLRAIFDKTQTSRQAELVRLLSGTLIDTHTRPPKTRAA